MPEDEKQRLDRELTELLEEIRVILPGVQLLGAFLFTVAFTNRFENLSKIETRAYYTAFVAAMVSSVLLIAPSAAHRILWRQPKKERLVHSASRFAFASTLALAVALASSAFLVASITYGGKFVPATTGAIIGMIALLWYALPLYQRLTGPEDRV